MKYFSTRVKKLLKGFCKKIFYPFVILRKPLRFPTGFTLIETLVALGLITTSLMGVFSLLQQIIGFLPISEQRLVATFLVQEGMEITRNLRDTNQIKGLAWDNGLTSCVSGCEADYQTQIENLLPWNARYLKYDGNFYNYASDTPTIYQRKITITPQGNDELDVMVEVFWQEKGRNHRSAARGNIYQW